MSDPSQHRASYDENGNVILPWETIEEDPSRQQEATAETNDDIKSLLILILDEGRHQYAASLRGAEKNLEQAPRELRGMLSKIKSFLLQPVWIPGKKRAVEHARLTLFALDMVRFGTTFACLFLILFGALNYQSLLSILESYIDPLPAEIASSAQHAATDAAAASEAEVVRERTPGDLLSLLPPVGPPENRLIIAKLGLNVPIVTPHKDALLAENWPKLEEDIQVALQDGVVHYPGTARPRQAGKFFLTGHSSYYPWAAGSYKSVFARLPELSVGDEYWVYYGGDKFRYKITEKSERRPSDVSVLDQPLGKRLGALMTCTPIGTTLRRLVLIAQEVDPMTGIALEVGEHQKKTQTPKVKVGMLPI